MWWGFFWCDGVVYGVVESMCIELFLVWGDYEDGVGVVCFGYIVFWICSYWYVFVDVFWRGF